MPEDWNPQVNAQQLVDQIEALFASYARRSEEARQARQESRKGIAGFFRDMFSPPAPMDPADQAFLDDAQDLACRLAQVLEGLPGDETRQRLAARAVDRYLVPKPRDGKTAQDWFLTAAEAFCLPLLPYLTRADLERSRDGILAATPRRYLFPKQAEVLKRIEALLA